MRLLLIRHGQTPSNLKHLLDTAEPGPGLTSLGQEQAAALPDALASEEIDALYASTLVRTQLTAAPLAAATGLEVRIRAGVRELTAGDLEMRGDDEAARLYMHTAFAWSAGDVGLRMPGGENGAEALARFDAVVAEAHGDGARTAAVVSHGAAIRMWVAARADNVDITYAAQHPLANTGIVILTGSPGRGWRALLWEGSSLGPLPHTPGPDDPTGSAMPTP
ncbi:histidine phosphatase family protein [Streptomyces coelicoflavus]|uniref:histidine phosphatase family protein n=1 Tax=Streptomyces coelicoflavus TaxID=285562 RepID=UPI0036D1BEFF